jgi:ATPase subunit of ABC transporter with duplicated ATPase domains
MIIVQNLEYFHPNKDILFDSINLTVNKHEKIALIGNNGAGKSTLLKLIAGQLKATSGTIKTDEHPYFIPQHFGQYDELTIAQALSIDIKLKALSEILSGNVSENNMLALDDDWTIEERCAEALAHWQLQDINLSQKMGTLSGGQKTKVFLAGINIHQPILIMMDEPSNHLDAVSRKQLYDFIQSTNSTLLIISHDRQLLNLLPTVQELTRRGITVYGGNYNFYTEQKAIALNAMSEDVRSKEKALRKAKELKRETMERQQKLDARGKKKQEKAGLPTISMNTLRNNAEKSTAKMKDVHAEKTGLLNTELKELRKELPDIDKMKIGFDNSILHTGKILVTAKEINYQYSHNTLWQQALNFQVTSGERIALTGANGSGKTTLIKLLLGQLQPSTGTIYRAAANNVYIDQDYSLINDTLSVYEQAQKFNEAKLQEHEVRSRLTHFLFTKEDWDKACASLSGGERMRLILCYLILSKQALDIIVLDEPTNNLDIQNIEILTAAINQYKGTVIAISHDAAFLEEIGIETSIELK